MSNFLIVTDSSSDLDAAFAAQNGIHILPLSFTMGEHTYRNYADNREMSPTDFYQRLREGQLATTSAINVAEYTDALEPLLQAGQDVLLLVFSSGLSTTYNSSVIAVEELREKYPQRKLYTVDTLCASLGQGLLVWLAAQERAKGKSIEEVRDWVVSHKLNVCHQVTVDSLSHLKRGGRISATTAAVGSMLQIKPLIHVDDHGHLINSGKVRGRQNALKALVDRMEQSVVEPREQTVFISHGDCLEDAELLAQMVKARFGCENFYINFIGPVIGAHTGPGVVALFYMGVDRA